MGTSSIAPAAHSRYGGNEGKQPKKHERPGGNPGVRSNQTN